ncbi:MAG: NAD(P)-dependent glycerol-3-phosphate dehydrogenase, partial [Spirochaetota bacterium]|nr:NAD(P)-dependent glycerol-3-phosphate dehydrogenase [Spirochaetota bacterium]
MVKVGILGVGSYAMALAKLLGEKGYNVIMWSHNEAIKESINNNHKNTEFLTDIILPFSVKATTSLQETVKDCNYLISVIPTQFIRSTISKLSSELGDDVIIINGAKGIENDTLLTISEIFEELFPKRLYSQLAYISGPSFAAEVAQKKITAVTTASYSSQTVQKVKELLSTNYFKVFTTNDVIGIEICGSLKNIIAIAAGIVDGLGLGANTQAALITGGLREITQIGLRKGANLSTFLGLAGIGDLVLTCTGDLSRNRFVGRELASGKKISQIMSEMSMVA